MTTGAAGYRFNDESSKQKGDLKMKVINATITKKNSGGYFSKSFYSVNWQNELRNWVNKCVNKNEGWALKLYQSTVVGPTFVSNAIPTRIIEV